MNLSCSPARATYSSTTKLHKTTSANVKLTPRTIDTLESTIIIETITENTSKDITTVKFVNMTTTILEDTHGNLSTKHSK